MVTLGPGLKEWLMQRLSALIIISYVLFLLSFFINNQPLEHGTWYKLFQLYWVKSFTLITLIAILYHSWIGLWTIATDYLKITSINWTFQLIIGLSLVTYLLWGIHILWG